MKTCLLYIVEIIIFLKYVEEHIYHVDEIRTTIGEAGVTLYDKKGSSLSLLISYSDHIIKPGQLQIDQYYKKASCTLNHRLTDQPDVLSMPNVTYTVLDPTGIEHTLNKLLRNGAPETFEITIEQLD